MSIEIVGTNHGLSVYTQADGTTGADTADNHRLPRPVSQEDMTAEGKYDVVVYNTFNDATSGDRYNHPSGHGDIELRLRHRHRRRPSARARQGLRAGRHSAP